MAVGSFDPRSKNDTSDINPADLAELLNAATHLDTAGFGLDELTVVRLAGLSNHAPGKGGADWASKAPELDTAAIIGLIKLFTLAEASLPGWEAGARSPVVPLAAELRSRSDYPDELTAWIKGNTSNRFLPYGSLMDRL